MFNFYVYLILYFNLPKIYESIECFDFQCYDGGKKHTDNCFQCENVSPAAHTQWRNHLDKMIYIYRKLQRYEIASQVENRLQDGMYCCRFNESIKKSLSCSLTFSAGAKDRIPHYGMGCDTNNIWTSAICKNRFHDSRCCSSDHCNAPNETELTYMMKEAIYYNPILEENNNQYYLIFIIVIVIILFFLACEIIRRKHLSDRYSQSTDSSQSHFYRKLLCFNKFFLILRNYKRRSNANRTIDKEESNVFGDSLLGQFRKPYNPMDSLQQLSCSGSGFGQPIMTRRTAATDISLIQPVGEGRFGTVWLGKWNGDNVAVKIFSSRDEVSWAREKDMYQQNFLRHSNVLGFVTSDRRDNGLATELWLVTDYHENGSLYEYLRSHMISVEQAIKMIRSITNGLAYLHGEINGLDGKPGIAHRDLKSRNILVKSCGECCIGDLGLAVRLNEDCSTLDLNNVGTRRYMAPEIILDKIVQPDMIFNGGLEAFKKADIYSYSLVIWEILRRCECISMDILSSSYELPYQNLVSNDPSIDEMKLVICDRKVRPPINNKWDNLNPLKDISKSMRECWFEEPASRLNIMRLKKIMSNAWNEISLLKNQISDIGTCNDFVSNDSAINNASYHCKSPFSNTTISSEFPSSLTSNDIIPNIVINYKDAFSTGSYCLGKNQSDVMIMHS